MSSDASPPPTFTNVSWDFNYDGQNFHADPQASGSDVTQTFETAGTFTVAARMTEQSGLVRMVTLDVTVAPSPPELTVEDDFETTVGTGVTLEASATDASGIASVDWQLSFDGGAYVSDPTLTTLTPNYTFPTFGDYDVLVTVTDNNGATSEDGFHVKVDEVAPTATSVTCSGPINEGQSEKFTVTPVDPDTSDVVRIFADWDGSGTFYGVNSSDWSIDAYGKISFTHVYDDFSSSSGFQTVIRLEDEGGQTSDYTVTVVVNQVSPTATLTAGEQFAWMQSSGQDAWIIQKGEYLHIEATAARLQGLVYHWIIADDPQRGGSVIIEDTTSIPYYALPDYTDGKIYQVTGWVTDQQDRSTAEQTIIVVVSWAADVSNAIYGTLQTENDALPAIDDRYMWSFPDADSKQLKANETWTVQLQLDQASLTFANTLGAAVRYSFTTYVYDVEQFTFLSDNNDLLSQTTTMQSSNTFQVGSWGNDRKIVVVAVAEVLNGQGQVLTSTLPYTTSAVTPLSPTIVQRIKNALNLLDQLCRQFADQANAVIASISRDSDEFLNTAMYGVAGAVGQFFGELSNPNFLAKKFLQWLGASSSISLSNTSVEKFLLQLSGLTCNSVLQPIRQQLVASNILAGGAVAKLLRGFDTNDPTQLLDFITDVPNRLRTLANQYPSLSSLFSSINLPSMSDILSKFWSTVTSATTKLAANALAKFAPGLNVLTSIYDGLLWVLDNAQNLADIFNQFLDGIPYLVRYDISDFQATLLHAMENSLPVLMNFAASQFGLGNLPNTVRQVLNFVPTEISKAMTFLVGIIASRLGGGTPKGLSTGMMAPKQTFTYSGKTYDLWVAQENNKPKVLIATGGKLIGELTSKSFDDKLSAGAKAEINALIKAAQLYMAAAKGNPQNLGPLQADLSTAALKVVKHIQDNACVVLGTGCFRGSELMELYCGWTSVEEIRPGDLVRSRSEFDPDGPLAWQHVEDIFERTGLILILRSNGREIGTTPEHPFWVLGQGWTEAGSLQIGGVVRTRDGWLTIDEIEDTGRYEKVYNVRVAEYHTYFVGGEGVVVWAHNACVQPTADVGTPTTVNHRDVYGTAQNTQANQGVPANQNPHAIKVNDIVKDLSATAPPGTYFVLNRQWDTALNRNGQNINQQNLNYKKKPDILVVEPLGGGNYKVFGISSGRRPTRPEQTCSSGLTTAGSQ